MDDLLQRLAAAIRSFQVYPQWLTVVICAGILLALILIAAWRLGRKRSARFRREEADREAQRDPIEAERGKLRIKHRVRPLTGLEDTLRLDRLPDGVYGFTLLPTRIDSPLLRTNQPDLFEVHKMADGAIHIVGFVSVETATAMETATSRVSVELFSQPTAGAFVAVSVPMAHVMQCFQHSSPGGSVLEMHVEPFCQEPEEPPASRKPPKAAERPSASSGRARSASR